MSFKEALQRKIEKNTVKSELHGEVVYLKKGSALSWMPLGIGDWFSEWRQIRPAVNEDGKISWINVLVGGWRNFWTLIIILAIVGLVFLQFADIFRYVETLTNDPCVRVCIEGIKY